MDETTRIRFAEIDEYINEMDDRLRIIAQQNVKMAEMQIRSGEMLVKLAEGIDRLNGTVAELEEKFQILGGMTGQIVDHMHEHKQDPNAHG